MPELEVGIYQYVFQDVMDERARQDEIWGEQHHPNGTGDSFQKKTCEMAREYCQQRASQGNVAWRDILFEELCEACAEKYDADVRRELIEVIAVAVAWIEDIDSRRETSASP